MSRGLGQVGRNGRVGKGSFTNPCPCSLLSVLPTSCLSLLVSHLCLRLSLPSPLPQCISEGLCPAFQDFSSCWELPRAHPPLRGAQSMAQACTHRDQGSLSSLVYSFSPAPASCQAPLPTIGLPSPCTVLTSLHFCLQPVLPLGLPFPAFLETSLNISSTLCSQQPPCISPSLPALLPTS